MKVSELNVGDEIIYDIGTDFSNTYIIKSKKIFGDTVTFGMLGKTDKVLYRNVMYSLSALISSNHKVIFSNKQEINIFDYI